jgi:hypothetical protein
VICVPLEFHLDCCCWCCFLVAIIDLIDWFLFLLSLNIHTYIYIFWLIKRKWFINSEINISFLIILGLIPLHLAGAYSAALPTTYGWVHFDFLSLSRSLFRSLFSFTYRRVNPLQRNQINLEVEEKKRKEECLFEKQNTRVIKRIWWKATPCVLTHTYGADDVIVLSCSNIFPLSKSDSLDKQKKIFSLNSIQR